MALIIAFLSKGLTCFLWSYLLIIHLQNIAVLYYPKFSRGFLLFCLFAVTLRKKNKTESYIAMNTVDRSIEKFTHFAFMRSSALMRSSAQV